MENLSESAQKVQKVLDKFKIKLEVKEFSKSTRTSKDAAKAIGCEIGQIAKSIAFISEDEPILVITSGPNRVSTRKIQNILDKKVRIMNPTEVKDITGFPIGGVPPVGHKNLMRIFIDEDLMEYEIIWSAAGNPHAVFKLTPQDLVKITSGEIKDIKE
jgi:Cys-tRNA(Pro) deacylase